MHHAALACMCQTVCDLTSSNVLGRLVQCEQKGWDNGDVGFLTQFTLSCPALCCLQ